MDLAELHAPWRDGEEISRLCPVSDDLSFNVLMPAFYWVEFNRLTGEGWDMECCYHLCWQDALAYDGLAIEGGPYEIFRRYGPGRCTEIAKPNNPPLGGGPIRCNSMPLISISVIE